MILETILGIADRFIPDPQKRAEARKEMLSALAEVDKAQNEVNKADAQSGNKFQSSWRPLIGYFCAFGVFYHFLLHPTLVWIATLNGMPVPPDLEWEQLSVLLMGLLGMSSLRTYEKTKKAGGLKGLLG